MIKRLVYIFAVIGFSTSINAAPALIQADDEFLEMYAADQPRTFTLYQNYPNPFNPSTTIKFELKAAQYVRIRVYNLLGREVATLFEGNKNVGVHEVRFDARELASGAYFYALETPNGRTMRQMVLAK